LGSLLVLSHILGRPKKILGQHDSLFYFTVTNEKDYNFYFSSLKTSQTKLERLPPQELFLSV
ncbi:MAG: hypothetical protein ACK56I_34350, partial [bacterium]